MTVFKVGDIVRKKHCSSPIVIKEIQMVGKGEYPKQLIRGKYKNSRFKVDWTISDYFLPFVEPESEPMANPTPKFGSLFQTISETSIRYGTYLNHTSIGQIALEMKPGGTVEAFKTTDIELVQPYTIRCCGSTNNTKSFAIAKDLVEVGDIIQCEGYPDMYLVLKLDTKDEQFTVFAGWKVAKDRIV